MRVPPFVAVRHSNTDSRPLETRRDSVFYLLIPPGEGTASMSSQPETEVIACPACRHLVRVPLDWLGQQVQCPECKALFRAPVRAGGKLTEPELISRSGPPPAAIPARPDAMLLLPAFGLLLCGVAGVVVNAALLYLFLSEPGGGKQWAKNQMPAMRKVGFGTPGPPETQEERDDQDAEKLARFYRWAVPLSLATSAVVFAGGLSIARRRNYRLAQVACVLASLNVAHLCCVPGALFGLWGLLMLGSDEGREHFLR
jgi:hypothetical protein